jgi:peptidoglycan/LPS O-acetylase OafA/YrhL
MHRFKETVCLDLRVRGEKTGSRNRHPAHRTQHIEGFDIIRLSAAAMVVFYHYFYWYGRDCVCIDLKFPRLTAFVWWGWVGVPIFFVISGFVIAVSAEGRSAADFFRGRMLRLVPGLWFFATLAFLVLLVVKAENAPTAILLFVKSLVLWPIGPWVDGVYWSLTVEILFYALVFLLLAAGNFDRLEPFVMVWFTVTTLFAIACLVDLNLNSSGPFDDLLREVRDAYVSRYLLLTTGSYFVLGLVTYFIYRYGLNAWRIFAFVGSFFAAEISIYFRTLREGPKDLGSSALVPGAVFAVAMLAVSVSAFVAIKSKSRKRGVICRATRTLGLASYPLYLVHFVTGRWIFSCLLDTGIPSGFAAVLSIVLCFLASILFVLALESRLRVGVAALYDFVTAMVMVAFESVRPAGRRV